MLAALLQMMGLPMGNPVHSRAEGATEPPDAHAREPDTSNPAHRVSVRRQEVKANKASPSKAKVGPTAAKTAKPPAKGAAPSVKAVPVKAKLVPAKAKATPLVAAKITSVTPKEPAPIKPAAVALPAKKSAVAVAAKPIAKATPAVAPKALAAKKPVATPVVLKTPPKVTKAKTPAVVVEPKAPAPVNAISPKPVTPVSTLPVLAPVPTKSGRPSSRLAQLTVPSMAQSVASTAAKASFNPSSHEPFAAPVIPAVVKKDSKLANNWKTTPVERLTDAELLAMPDSEYMNEVQLAAFKLKLTALKREILSNAGETTEHLREDTSVVPDPADRATIEEEHALELRTRDRERKLLKKIEQSIVRIDSGDYGYCDETGEAIGVGRLLARPTATLSLEAQQRRELKQKMFGD